MDGILKLNFLFSGRKKRQFIKVLVKIESFFFFIKSFLSLRGGRNKEWGGVTV